MGLLDFDDHYVPPYTPSRGTVRKASGNRASSMDSEVALSELNNMGHRRMSEDYEDSPYADRKPQDYGQSN